MGAVHITFVVPSITGICVDKTDEHIMLDIDYRWCGDASIVLAIELTGYVPVGAPLHGTCPIPSVKLCTGQLKLVTGEQKNRYLSALWSARSPPSFLYEI